MKSKISHLIQNTEQIKHRSFWVRKKIVRPSFVITGKIGGQKACTLALICASIIIEQSAQSGTLTPPQVRLNPADSAYQAGHTISMGSGNALNGASALKMQKFGANQRDFLLKQPPPIVIPQLVCEYKGEQCPNESTNSGCQDFFDTGVGWVVHLLIIALMSGLTSFLIGLPIFYILLRILK